MKVLMTFYSTPYSTWMYYEHNFRKEHQVVTIGTTIGQEEFDFFKTSLPANMAFYNETIVNRYLNQIFRLATPCDIVTGKKRLDLDKYYERIPFEPDLFIWTDSYHNVLPIHLEKIKCPKVALIGDSHFGLDWRVEYAKNYDYVFVLFADHLDYFRAGGCKNVFWLPVACDPEFHGKYDLKKIYDIIFIGSTNNQIHFRRNKLLKKILENGFDLHIDYLALQEMAMAYSRSKIIFNRSVKKDINMRVFESLCSGSLLFTNKLPPETRFEELFQDKKHLLLYEEDNLLSLLEYYLENEAERKMIAEAGRLEVLKKHTYLHRVQEIIAKVFN